MTIERRRPIDTTGAPGRAFEERVVEVHETEEVPVVAKTARLVEEVAIRKEESERTETVRDTVRREDVEATERPTGPLATVLSAFKSATGDRTGKWAPSQDRKAT